MASNRDTKDAKSDVVLEEYAAGTKDGVEGVLTERDNFGARKKVDPVEIKLVRKIDMYMMVSQSMGIRMPSDNSDIASSRFFGSCTSSISWTATP